MAAPALFLLSAAVLAAKQKPNVLLIVADCATSAQQTRPGETWGIARHGYVNNTLVILE